MRILRTTVTGIAAAAALGGLMTAAAGAQTRGGTGDAHTMPMTSKAGMSSTMSKEQRIANAVSAAPAAISAKATVLDWPANEGEAPAVLRAGTNGWTCLPDMPDTQGNDPVCMDKPWMEWVDAYMAHKAPSFKTVGIGYMTASGGGWTSNTDPYATKKTADNHWHLAPPHVMILVPDLKSLDGLSTDPNSGGPYVMYPGTPYAHVMAPIGAATGMMMTK